MDQSTNNLTGALPLGSYAGSPAEGACELAIILKNAVQKDIHVCVQQDSWLKQKDAGANLVI